MLNFCLNRLESVKGKAFVELTFRGKNSVRCPEYPIYYRFENNIYFHRVRSQNS